MNKFYDTNALLDLQEEILNDPFIISSKSLEEIEHIKVSNKPENIKYKARKVGHILDNNINKFKVSIVNSDTYKILEQFNLPESPDNLILACAYIENKINPLIFISGDICCKLLGRNIFQLNVKSINDFQDEMYKGYSLIKGSSNEINEYMNNIDYSKWYINQYLIIENTDENKATEMKYNGEKFVSLKLPSSNFIKGKNSLQRCALDLLMNKDIPIVAILGGYGSGKTMLSMKMALYGVTEKGNQTKIVGIRECMGEGKEIGYLPGSFDEKTGKFFQPLEQQLDGGEFEMKGLTQRGTLEVMIPYYLKGTTYSNSILLCDEAEDLTESQIRLIGTRLGENSRVFFDGDFNQSLINKTQTNPLVKMCNELKGNPMFGCIVLDEDVRSNASKVFANLFKM